MTADIIDNKKRNRVVTELFIESRKIYISILFITQSYFQEPKDIRLNFTHFFIMKIKIKRNFSKLN